MDYFIGVISGALLYWAYTFEWPLKNRKEIGRIVTDEDKKFPPLENDVEYCECHGAPAIPLVFRCLRCEKMVHEKGKNVWDLFPGWYQGNKMEDQIKYCKCDAGGDFSAPTVCRNCGGLEKSKQ